MLTRQPTFPRDRIWHLLNAGLLVAGVGIAALAVALSRGAADPPRAGPQLWESRFGTEGEPDWQIAPPRGGTAQTGPAGLGLTFPGAPVTGPGKSAWAITTGPEGDFTFEAAGVAAAGSPAYGLVFNWQDAAHYSALLVNGNGYAEAFRQSGREREVWFAWQQWPHIVLAGEANRLRVDQRGDRATLRINDEVLVAEVPAAAGGGLGVLARFGVEAGEVVFGWAQLWAPRR